MGLGPYHTIGLAEARERARKCRQQRLDGIDPIEARKKLRLDQKLAKAKEVTFRRCAELWMAKKGVEWSAKRAIDTRRRFELYVYPHLNKGNMPVQVLDGNASNASQLIADLLTPIWETKIDTAEEVRKQIDGTLQYAAAKQYIENPNAASLKGPLGILLPAHKTFKEVKHHAALPFDEIGKFMADLRSRVSRSPNVGLGKRSRSLDVVEFLILTAVRVDQVTAADWDDFDLDNKIWFCSEHKTRKKTKQDYVIPLSKQAMAILERMQVIRANDYVFPGYFGRSHIRKDGLLNSLRASLPDLFGGDLTLHGFRTSFKTWAEEHNYREKDSEMALGHTVGNNVRNIYARYAQKIEPRRIMMQDWADYCDRTERLPGDVVQFQRKRKEEQTG
jgi:integrase